LPLNSETHSWDESELPASAVCCQPITNVVNKLKANTAMTRTVPLQTAGLLFFIRTYIIAIILSQMI
jgi:hypothetical protein